MRAFGGLTSLLFLPSQSHFPLLPSWSHIFRLYFLPTLYTTCWNYDRASQAAGSLGRLYSKATLSLTWVTLVSQALAYCLEHKKNSLNTCESVRPPVNWRKKLNYPGEVIPPTQPQIKKSF